MQTSKEHVKRQQAILKKFGFYNGKIDGIWGPATIKAKRVFEADPSFKPGYPNNGMPFASKGPYPKGIKLVPGTINLTCDGIDDVLRSEAENKNAGKESKPTNDTDLEITVESDDDGDDLGLEITAEPMESKKYHKKKKKKNKR